MSSITITTQSFGAINSTVTGQAPATITLELGTPGPQGIQGIQGGKGDQGDPGPAFMGGPITSAITYGVGTYTTVFENGDIYTEDTSSGAYGVVYINGLEASDGSNTIKMSSTGIQFPDSSVQTTGFPGSSAFYPSTGNPSGFVDAGYVSSALTGYATESFVTSQGYITTPFDSYNRLNFGTGSNPDSFPVAGHLWFQSDKFRYSTSTSSVGNVIASEFFVSNAYAPLASPTFTGTPLAPTASTGTSSTQIATTAFVQDAVIAGSAHAETLQATVRNNTGATLSPFTVVYISGALGNKATVAKAKADAEATSSGTFAITEASIANNADGVVISAGVLSNVDTSAYTDGDKLYLSPTTAGAVTTTKPSAPNHLVYVGVVTRSHPTQGTVSVRIQNGYELDELHDVAITSKTDLDLLTYESSTSLWKNKSFSTLGLATLASPTFSGTPSLPTGTTATTQTAGDNSTKLATTAYVVGQAGSATPLVDGTAAVGTSLRYARQDHVHPTDTTRAPLASPSLTGVPLSTTAAADTNTTQIATTAFVVGQASSTAPVINGTATVGTSLKYARADHVHPTDTTRAPLASPTFTGTVTIPAGASISGFAPLASPTFTGTPLSTTAAVDTNTTQIATTAYVIGQGYAKLASPTFTGTPTLPTGTTAVTQTAGNNTTAVATTAFVTAAVPAFATTADINEPASTTKAASVANVRDMMLSNGYQFLYLAVGSSGTSLSGYYNSNGGRFKDYASSTTALSYGQWTLDTAGASIGYAGYTRGDNLHVHNWSKKVWIAGRCLYGVWSTTAGIGDANTFARVNLGGKNAFGSGDLTSTLKGIGWKFAGGGTSPLVLTVVNGSARTDVTSSFTPVAKQAFDWVIYSDGAGNVTLYVNDAQVATTSAGPTGTQTYGLYIEGCDATATASTAISISTFGTKIYHGT